MITGCPGSATLTKAPSLKIKECPECGGEIELFSNDIKSKCEKCSFTAYNDIQNCITWCSYARQCVGDEFYEEFMRLQEEAEAEKKALKEAENKIKAIEEPLIDTA